MGRKAVKRPAGAAASGFPYTFRRLGHSEPRVMQTSRATFPAVRLLTRSGVRLAAARVRSVLRGASAEARERATGRVLADELGRARGLYAKLGQHLAMRVDLLAPATRHELEALYDAAPPLPISRLETELRRWLGPIESHFREIEPQPIGTASIAQVHRARLLDGTPVAIKVRHPELSEARVERDLRGLRRVARPLGRWLGLGDVEPLLAELTRALREELDLEREGRTAEAVARALADTPGIVVPRVHWQATARGVLTLDYVPTVRLDDPAALAARGIAAGECLDLIATAYGLQVFRHGLFHADPHPGNLFALDERHPDTPPGGVSGHPRVLFLDFGLSKRLPDALRRELRLGFRALLRRDLPELLAALERVGAVVPGREPQAAVALREVLEAGAADALSAGADRIAALRALGRRLVRERGAFRIPPDLLLYARTLAHVFDLAARIAPDRDPMPRLLPHLLAFLSEREASSAD